MNPFVLRSIVMLFVGIAISILNIGAVAGELTVTLRDAPTTVAGDSITIGNIAEVDGGTTSLRRRISELDLETLQPNSPGCRVSKRQVQLRILVDGHNRTSFQVLGPADVAVRCSSPRKLRIKLEELFTDEIARQFGVQKEIIAVRLVNQQQVEMAESKLRSTDFTAAVLLPSQLPIGKTLVQVEFEESSGHRFLEKFDTQVIMSMDVVVATQQIARGELFDQSMFRVIQRPILSRSNFAEPDSIIGRIATREIGSNEVVLNTHLAEVSSSRTSIVKRNDLIDVIVKLGPTEIRLKNAKAMASGNVGETIAVLNTLSDRPFNATIVGPNLAKASPSFGAVR